MPEHGRTVFDVGMYDGADTAYYLELGFGVVAIEANPALVEQARERFAREIAAGRLTLEGVAVAAERGSAALALNQKNPGGSSLDAGRLQAGEQGGALRVRTVPLADLFEAHGVPWFMKVDIEGADRHAVLALTRERAPAYVSFEMGDDAEELLGHLSAIGYRRFKVIHQLSFRELSRVDCLQDRIAGRLRRLVGRPEPAHVRRGGRWFASGHSSGPIPEASDGPWSDAGSLLRRWRDAHAQGRAYGWYDLHASLR
jgi:FkbM family methyltransferase